MTRLLLALSTALLLSGCKSKEEQADDLQGDYIDAVCRLYSEAACVQNMKESCGFSISFDSAADCVAFMVLFMDPECDMGEALLEEEAAANACIDSIEAIDCDAEPLCSDDGAFTPETTGDCATVAAALEDACPSDTTTGT